MVSPRTMLLLLSNQGAIRYLLRDEFNDTRAAGAVDGTPATPGPGTRTVTDTESKITVSGGDLSFASGKAAPAFGDPACWYDSFAQTAGRMFLGSVTPSAINRISSIGWDLDQAGGPFRHGWTFQSDARIDITDHSANAIGDVATYTVAPHRWAIVFGVVGSYHLIKGGTYANWTLLWRVGTGSGATYYPSVQVFNPANPSLFQWIRIPRDLWLPTPLAYDTFTRDDGAPGSTETTGPDGQAVTARTWTTINGTWAISSNKLVATAAGILSPGAIGADLQGIVKVTTPAAGTTPAGILVRYTDADNYWYIKITPGTAGTDFALIQREAAGETTRATADVDWTANTEYEIQWAQSDNDIDVYADGSKELSYGSADFAKTVETVCLRDEGNSNFKFDDVLLCAKSGSVYNGLNKYAE